MNTSLSTRSTTKPSSAQGTRGAGGDESNSSSSARRRSVRKAADRRQRLEILFLTGPAVVVFLAFVILPVAMAAYYGFFRWQGYGPPTDFVGLGNYKIIFTDSAFHEVLSHNAFIVILSLVVQGPVAI